MRARRNVPAPFALRQLHVRRNPARILAVRRNQTRRRRENPPQHLFIIHQHPPRGGAHEYLQPRNPTRIRRANVRQIVHRRPQVKSVIHPRIARRNRHFLPPFFHRQSRRIRVRHLHIRGDPPRRRRARLRVDVRLVRQPRLAKMNLIIHQPRQNQTTPRIHFASAPARFSRQLPANRVNASAANPNVRGEHPTIVHHPAVANQSHGGNFTPFCRLGKSPKFSPAARKGLQFRAK